ncbi:amino acid adenylation domain-containing protein [Mucilaginibacter terrae]|uniref:Amino acid adenylation domain-containing protein n=1 Tax=Mucilaginibacter terrae TaxID=1955052 RepID=A0ABU3GMG7_9SPHI|nr:amino acid adenylation domain-containing protein [Mucilaginibacter terrae]MDT3400983.1 amino acid adenylation domain-containing protein [Mucilaginibacter terrae]
MLFTIIKHHIIGDGWSTGVMLEDLAKFYNAYNQNHSAYLATPTQLSDYASWQAAFKQSAVYHETVAFWLNEYKNGAPVLNLPTDRPRQPTRTYKGHRIDVPLSPNLASKVKAMGAKAGASLVTTLLTAFEILLYQKTQQTDVVVGLPAAGQAASGLTGVVGHCVNLLPLLSHIAPASSFIDYLKKRKKEVLDAYDHQNITFGELIRKLYIPRDASRIPLVPVIFNIDMGMDNAVAFDGLELKLISNPRSYENFELYLNVTRSKEDIVLEWSYNTDIFDAQTIEGYNSSYVDILQAMADTPDANIAQIAGVQQEPVNLSVISGDKAHIEANTNLITLFGATAKQYAHKIAVTFNQTTLTYAQLGQKVNQLSAFLVQKGVSKGDIVALLLSRSAQMVVSMLAVLKAGAAYLPLDPNYPEERIAFMLEDSLAKLLLVSQPYKGIYGNVVNEIIVEDAWTQLDNYDTNDTAAKLIGDDLAYIIYTSGSTGKPKGVKITHGNLINFLLSMQKVPGVNSTDRLLAITTISFDIAGLELYVPLISGAELIVADAETARDGRLLVNRITESNITVLQATPSTWQMLIDSGMQRRENLKALSGGEPLSKELANQLLTLTASLWNMYGPTETTVWSTLKQVIKGEKLITVGKPISNTQVYIMNEAGNPLPAGTSGEICIGGYGVAKGYLNRAQLTAEKFVTDTIFQTHPAKLYRTGDLGKLLDNGEIQCLGRIDDQVKIRGHRIELGEIENSISLLDGVKQCVVMAYDDALLNKYLVAFVITDNAHAGLVTSNITNQWREKLAAYLPEYMLPEDFIHVAAFPKTPNGKTDRKALPKPERTQQYESKSEALPVTDEEKLIATIFAEILGLTNVCVTDDFFALGGHSLLAIKVMVAIEKLTGDRLPLAAFFNNSTVEKLAALLAGHKTVESWETVVPIKKDGIKPPLFLVHGSGLNLLLFKSIGDHFDEDHPLYGIQAIGLASPAALPETVEAIAAYHVSEILKARPEGPYAIAGYSYGGFIAYEIVKKLINSGKKVSFFGIIDTDAWAAMPPKTTAGRIIKKVIRQFHKIPFFINSFIKYPGEALAYQQLVFKRKFAQKDLSRSASSVQQYTAYEQQLRKSYNNVVKAYRITPFDIEVSLFKVEKRIYFVDNPKFMGWNRIALKGVKVYTVPGDHNTFRLPPNDKIFAAVIQKAMDVSVKN